METWGLAAADVIMKSDQQPAIVAIVDSVMRNRNSAKTTPEHSPIGESEANGDAESCVWTAESQFRTLKDHVSTKLQAHLITGHPLVPWVVRHGPRL